MLSAIIVAAGGSTRAGTDKVFARIGDRPLIAYTIDAFQSARCVDEIILVGRDSKIESLRQLISVYPKISGVVPGGVRRQDSVRNGLDALSDLSEFVAIHDAARPLIIPGEIERVFAVAKRSGAAALGVPVTDTLKTVDLERRVTGSLERENVFAMQTPQVFRRRLLADAYRQLDKTGASVTDEVSVVEAAGSTVEIVPGRAHNLKVTFASDLEIAQSILEKRR